MVLPGRRVLSGSPKQRGNLIYQTASKQAWFSLSDIFRRIQSFFTSLNE
jgi:hypothetical protein